jgi:hypothetical protein
LILICLRNLKWHLWWIWSSLKRVCSILSKLSRLKWSILLRLWCWKWVWRYLIRWIWKGMPRCHCLWGLKGIILILNLKRVRLGWIWSDLKWISLLIRYKWIWHSLRPL